MATAGRRSYHQVINIVSYKHWPRFLDTERNRTDAAWEAGKRDLNALRDGPAALVAKFKSTTVGLPALAALGRRRGAALALL